MGDKEMTAWNEEDSLINSFLPIHFVPVIHPFDGVGQFQIFPSRCVGTKLCWLSLRTSAI